MDAITLVGSSAIDLAAHADESENLLYRSLFDLAHSASQSNAGRINIKFFLPQGLNETELGEPQPVGFDAIYVRCPQIPIPKIGAKFFGKQLSDVQAVDYFPYPTAYTASWMGQKLKEWWTAARTAETPFMMYAHTPDLFSHQLFKFRKRELFRRHIRIPLIGTHHSGFLQYVDEQLKCCLQSLLANPRLTNDVLFAKHGFLRAFVPIFDEKPELIEQIRDAVIGLRSIVENLFVNRRPLSNRSRKWGDICLGVAGLFSKDVRYRIAGLKSISHTVHSSIDLANQICGLDLRKLPNVELNYEQLLDEVLRQSAMHFGQIYLRHCYSQYDRVITFEGDSGVKELQEIGIAKEQIIVLENGELSVARLVEQYQEIVDSDRQVKIPTRRMRLDDLAFAPPPNEKRRGEGVLAMSDVHLGDGSGSSRAMALLKLAPKLEEMGISRVDIVGDLCERTAGSYRFNKHKKMFNNALHQISQLPSNGSAKSIFLGEMQFNRNTTKQEKSVDVVLKELQRAAIRCSLSLNVDGQTLGFDLNQCKPIREVNLDRGNHDDGEDLEKIIPAGRESKSLIRYDRRCGVVYVHGHIVGVPEYFEALTNAQSVSELEDSLTEEKLRKSLETAAVAYGVSTTLWRAFQPIVNFRSLYKEYFQSWLSGVGQWLNRGNESGRNASKEKSEFARFVSGILSPIDNSEDAVRLAAAVHDKENWCWAVCEGHSHQWSIEKLRVQHPKTQAMVSKFRINCGKFHGKRTTCVIIQFPDVAALEWDEKSESWYVLEHVRLSDEEIDEVLSLKSKRSPEERVLKVNASSNGHHVGANGGKEINDNQTIIEVPLEGGGHIARFWAMKELYEIQGPLHVLGSGRGNASFADEHVTGYGITHDSAGNVARLNTVVNHFVRHQHVRREADVWAERLTEFKHAITDFGPTLVEAVKIGRKRGIKHLPDLWHLSHQAALQDHQQGVPRPENEELLNWISGQSLLNAISGDFNIGFHYERYNDNIFTPIMSDEVLKGRAHLDGGFVLVYLRGTIEEIVGRLCDIDPKREIQWRVYTKHSIANGTPFGNICCKPVGPDYRRDLERASGILMNTGFMGTSEALHLGIPLATVPIKSQYEQACNAAALRKITDVCVVDSLVAREDQQAVFQYFKKHIAKNQLRLNRTGMIGGPVGPFVDIRNEVIHRIFGAAVRQG